MTRRFYPSARTIVVIIAVLGVAIAAVIVDKVRFESACETVREESNRFGGHAYSVGGWPIGREFVVRFDAPLTDARLRRLVAAYPQSHRIVINLALGDYTSDDRVVQMRKVVAPYNILIWKQKAGAN